ncbi:MAG: glycoside hydrolase family 3 N-terminal domain-containing protein [Flavitalea sp.]
MKIPVTLILILFTLQTYSQQKPSRDAVKWADSVFQSLSDTQKIAQLMVVRMSAIDPATKKVVFYEEQVKDAILKYNIGGICLFQGGPLKQAAVVNTMQAAAKTPLFVSIDAENGLGMRMDSVTPLPRQMMLGAGDDPTLIYEYGRLVGQQLKRTGIQINYGPVMDVNNNPDNPVINDRSFGEDKHKVALFGIQYMRGLQDEGVMACAKHFPGHGNVNVDSHLDLPVINKSKKELDSLELYPFRQIIKAGVGSVMIAHLSIPSIDNGEHIASSISYKTVTGLLKNELGFNGIILTDALEMKGVSKYFPAGEVSVQALIAGNDMLCLPGDIPGSIQKILEAINDKKLTWNDINGHLKKVLLAKYQYGLSTLKPVNLNHITEDINQKTNDLRRLIAERSITLVKNSEFGLFPLQKGKRVAYVGIGINKDNEFAKQLRNEYDAQVYYFDYNMSDSLIAPMMQLLKNRYDVVVIGLHRYSRFPANNFGISKTAFEFVSEMQHQFRSITVAFGNPYVLKNMCDAKVIVECYEDDSITHHTAVDVLTGRMVAKGKLPVTVCPDMKYGTGIVALRTIGAVRPSDQGFRTSQFSAIDSIVTDAIKQRAMPGAVVLVAKDGKIAYERGFGYLGYDSLQPVYPETMYDLASVTKVMCTTLAIMKLYDEGKLNLTKSLGTYLPWVKGTNKDKLVIWNILLHQAGLKAFIPFYRETLDTARSEAPSYKIYATAYDSSHRVRVASHLYMRNDWTDTIYKRILTSAVGPQGVYVYSDLDYIFLGKIVEKISGMSLDKYVKKIFYDPLKLSSMGFRPFERFDLERIAPTETESIFRQQRLWGDVHDPGSAMLGEVAGHAGLFSTAYDLTVLCQMLLNGGKINNIRFFKKETVNLFTSYHANSRRGLGFDKPDKDNYLRAEPYPAANSSKLTFGHTGFTGTCVWVDPAYNLIFIFLCNRVYNNGDANKFLHMNIRPKVFDVIYGALLGPAAKIPIKPMDHLNL